MLWKRCVQAVGSDSNVICLNGSCASYCVAKVAIHKEVASKGTGVFNVHNVDMAMCWLSTSPGSS
jgi:hypothetical protein